LNKGARVEESESLRWRVAEPYRRDNSYHNKKTNMKRCSIWSAGFYFRSYSAKTFGAVSAVQR